MRRDHQVSSSLRQSIHVHMLASRLLTAGGAVSGTHSRICTHMHYLLCCMSLFVCEPNSLL